LYLLALNGLIVLIQVFFYIPGHTCVMFGIEKKKEKKESKTQLICCVAINCWEVEKKRKEKKIKCSV